MTSVWSRRKSSVIRAKQFTGDLAFGKDVKVIVRDVDRYGRTVGEVVLPGGRSLNRELVKAGLAWWYRQYAGGDRELERLEAAARAAWRGLWRTRGHSPCFTLRRSAIGGMIILGV